MANLCIELILCFLLYIEAELVENKDKQDELCCFVSRVEERSVASGNGNIYNYFKIHVRLSFQSYTCLFPVFLVCTRDPRIVKILGKTESYYLKNRTKRGLRF